MNKKELSKKLKTARIEAGLKQEEIAAHMGLPISAISMIENGTRKVDVIELSKIASFYAKPVEWFLYGDSRESDRRWYDNDKKLSEALKLLKRAPLKYQKSCACAIIGFLKESGLIK